MHAWTVYAILQDVTLLHAHIGKWKEKNLGFNVKPIRPTDKIFVLVLIKLIDFVKWFILLSGLFC